LNHFEKDEKVDSKKITCVAVSPNFNLLISASNQAIQVWVYHPFNASKQKAEKFKRMHLGYNITSLAFSSDEKYLLVGCEDNTLLVTNFFY